VNIDHFYTLRQIVDCGNQTRNEEKETKERTILQEEMEEEEEEEECGVQNNCEHDFNV
jgi:hypothetical protein